MGDFFLELLVNCCVLDFENRFVFLEDCMILKIGNLLFFQINRGFFEGREKILLFSCMVFDFVFGGFFKVKFLVVSGFICLGFFVIFCLIWFVMFEY